MPIIFETLLDLSPVIDLIFLIITIIKGTESFNNAIYDKYLYSNP